MPSISIYPYAEGVRVRALHTITENGDPSAADPNVPFLNADYVSPRALRCSEMLSPPVNTPGPTTTGGQTNGSYIHSASQGMGTVVGVDDNCPTVRFDNTGTATIVAPEEIEFVSESANYRKGSRVRCGFAAIPVDNPVEGGDTTVVKGDTGTVVSVQPETLTIAFDKVATLDFVDRSVTVQKDKVLIIEAN